MPRSRTILLVEDNADDVALTLRAFGKTAFKNEIVVVSDGQEALDYLLPREEANAAPLPALRACAGGVGAPVADPARFCCVSFAS